MKGFLYIICFISFLSCNRATVDNESSYTESSSRNLASDIASSHLGVITGSTHDIYVTENFPNAKSFRFDNISDIITNLGARKIDLAVIDIPIAKDIISRNDNFEILDTILFSTEIALAFSLDKADLQKEFNLFLDKFILTEEYKNLEKRWHIDNNIVDIPEIKLPSSGPILRLGVNVESSPDVLVVNNRITGFEVELIKHFAKNNGYQLEVLSSGFPGLIAALSVNKIDIAASQISVTEERKNKFLFSHPHSSTRAGILSYKEKVYKDYVMPEVKPMVAGQPLTIDDTLQVMLDGKNVAVLEGTGQEKYLTNLFPDKKNLVFKDFSDVIQSLVANKSEFAIIPQISARAYLEAYPSFQIVLDNFYFCNIGFGVNKKNPQLKAELNAFLNELKQKNELKKLNEKWTKALDNGRIDNLNLQNNHKKTLRVGSSGVAIPYNFIANGKVEGFDIELISLFCKKADYNLEVIQMPFSSIIAALASNKIDVIANSLLQTKEREEKIDFTNPYSREGFAILANRERINSEVEDKGFFDTLKESFNNNIIKEDRYKMILDGLYLTILISFFSIILGSIIGMLICFLSMHNSPILKNFAACYISIIRGTPVLVLLMINFYVVFANIDISASLVAIISFAMNFGAYVSEMFRSSIISIDKGQKEAGLAMGFTTIQTFIFIVAPQAIKRVMPVYKGESISLVKMTSIVGYIAVQDLTKVSDIIRSRTFDAFFPLLVSAVLYFFIAYLFSKLLDIISSKKVKS